LTYNAFLEVLQWLSMAGQKKAPEKHAYGAISFTKTLRQAINPLGLFAVRINITDVRHFRVTPFSPRGALIKGYENHNITSEDVP
jgi:hypothetical protein